MNKPAEISEEKQKALEAARLQIEKAFGKGSIMKLGEGTGPTAIPVIPTGSILLDAALGVGGYPRGRVMEIFGPESSGKTTLALHAIAEAPQLSRAAPGARNGGGQGAPPHGLAGPPHEPGAAQAYRDHLQVADLPGVHQPDP